MKGRSSTMYFVVGCVALCAGMLYWALQQYLRTPMRRGYAHAISAMCIGAGLCAANWLPDSNMLIHIGIFCFWAVLLVAIVIGYERDVSVVNATKRRQKNKVDRHFNRQLRKYQNL